MSSGQLPTFGGGVMSPIDPPSGGAFKMPARPEAAGDSASATPAQQAPVAAPQGQAQIWGQPNGLICPKCGAYQTRQPSGDACGNGCGPIPGMTEDQARAMWAKQAAPPQPQQPPTPIQPTPVPFDPSLYAPPAPPVQPPAGPPHPEYGGRTPDLAHAAAQFEAGLEGGSQVVEPPKTRVQDYAEARAAFDAQMGASPIPTPTPAQPPSAAPQAPAVTGVEPSITVQVTLRGGWSRIQGAIEALREMGVLS